jgi:hypothetical protein
MTRRHDNPTFHAAATAALLAAALLASACTPAEPAIHSGPATLPAGQSSARFFSEVARQQTVSQNQAAHGVLMLMHDGKDPAADFAQRVNMLLDAGVVDRSWTFDADAPLTRGQLAYMICQACDFPGGVVLTLTGPSQRYCLREMQYRNMMVDGAVYTDVTGFEYVGVMGRADTYKRTGKVPNPDGTVEP